MNLKCERCGYEWVSKTDKMPKTCSSCKTPYWQKPISEYWKQVRKKNKLKRELNEKTDAEKA